MYTVYTDKAKNEKQHQYPSLNNLVGFQNTEILHSFLHNNQKYFNDEEVFIISPGYLSRTDNTSKQMCNNFFSYHNGKNKYKVMMLSGMNNYVSMFYKHLPNPYFRNSPFYLSSNRDHRKMSFICKFENSELEKIKKTGNREELIDSKCEDTSLNKFINLIVDKVTVDAVMIGSSNFSKTTYMGGNDKNHSADKGEADIFMYRDIFVDFSNVLEERSDIILSKSINKVNDENFLKNMLKSVLNEAFF